MRSSPERGSRGRHHAPGAWPSIAAAKGSPSGVMPQPPSCGGRSCECVKWSERVPWYVSRASIAQNQACGEGTWQPLQPSGAQPSGTSSHGGMRLTSKWG